MAQLRVTEADDTGLAADAHAGALKVGDTLVVWDCSGSPSLITEALELPFRLFFLEIRNPK